MIDFVFKLIRNYYLQVFLEECKFIVKEKKIRKYINDDYDSKKKSSDEEADEELMLMTDVNLLMNSKHEIQKNLV